MRNRYYTAAEAAAAAAARRQVELHNSSIGHRITSIKRRSAALKLNTSS